MVASERSAGRARGMGWCCRRWHGRRRPWWRWPWDMSHAWSTTAVISTVGLPLFPTPIPRCNNSIPFHSSPVQFIPFRSIPVHSIPVHSSPFQSIPVHSIPFHSIPAGSLSLGGFRLARSSSLQVVQTLWAQHVQCGDDRCDHPYEIPAYGRCILPHLYI